MVSTSTLPSSGGSGKCGSQAQDAADVCGERGEEDDLDVDSWEHGRTTGSQYLGQRVRRALVDGPVTTLIDGTVVKWLPVRQCVYVCELSCVRASCVRACSHACMHACAWHGSQSVT